MIKIDVLAEIGEATKSIKKFTEDTSKNIDKMAKQSTSSFAKLGNAVIAFNQGLELLGKVTRVITSTFKDGIKSAVAQEEAINDLNIALQGAGKFSLSASEDMQEFASTLQATTTFSDDAILKAAALGVQMGKLSGESLKKATKAALDMSSALNIDLDTAMRLIVKSTTDGGSGLKRYGVIVEKGKTSSESLANAIQAVNSKFGGTAEGKILTYGGAIAQAANSYDDMLEEVGNLIIKNPLLIKIINMTSEVFQALGKYIKENQQAFIDISKKGILKMVDAFGFLLAAIDYPVRALKVLRDTAVNVFKFVLSSIASLTSTAISFLGKFAKFIGRDLKDSVASFGKKAEDVAVDQIGSLVDGLGNVQKSATEETFVKLKEQTALFSLELEKTSTEQKKVVKGQRDIAGTSEETSKQQIEDLKKVQDELEKQRQAYLKLGADVTAIFAGAANSSNDITESLNDALSDLQKESERTNLKIDAELNAKLGELTDVVEIEKAYAEAEAKRAELALENENKRQDLIAKAEKDRMKSNEKAALDIIKGGASVAADAYLPGSGQFVGPILDLLNAGGESIKQTVKEIYRQIPEIVMALVDAIPYVVEAFVEASPKMVMGLSNKLSDPKFLLKFTANLVSALARGVATLPQTLIDSFKNSTFTSVIRGLFDVGKWVVDSIWDALKGVGNFFEKVFRFEGGGKGAVEDFLGLDFPWIAFAKGGLVPGTAKSKGDSRLNDIIPAMLSPGEVILPRSVVGGGPGKVIDFLKQIGIAPEGFAFGGIGKKGWFSDATSFVGDVYNSVAGAVTDAVGGVVDSVVGVADLAIPGNLSGIYESLKRFVANIDVMEFIANPIRETQRLVKSVAKVFQPKFRQMMTVPGMANGGMIRSVSGGIAGMDSVGARLMPGELVIDRGTTERLDRFLSSKSNSDEAAITNALLGKIVQLLSKDQTIESEITINREAFANIILSLSRNNQRLSA